MDEEKKYRKSVYWIFRHEQEESEHGVEEGSWAGERVPLYEDLQGFWDMIKLQVDNVDDNFAEINTMSQNGWKEVPRLVVSKPTLLFILSHFD